MSSSDFFKLKIRTNHSVIIHIILSSVCARETIQAYWRRSNAEPSALSLPSYSYVSDGIHESQNTAKYANKRTRNNNTIQPTTNKNIKLAKKKEEKLNEYEIKGRFAWCNIKLKSMFYLNFLHVYTRITHAYTEYAPRKYTPPKRYANTDHHAPHTHNIILQLVLVSFGSNGNKTYINNPPCYLFSRNVLPNKWNEKRKNNTTTITTTTRNESKITTQYIRKVAISRRSRVERRRSSKKIINL